jgi:hypothetical protein
MKDWCASLKPQNVAVFQSRTLSGLLPPDLPRYSLRLYYHSALEDHALADAFYDQFVSRFIALVEQLIDRGIKEGRFRKVDTSIVNHNVTWFKTTFKRLTRDASNTDASASEAILVRQYNFSATPLCRCCSTSGTRLRVRRVRRKPTSNLTSPEVMALSKSSYGSSAGKQISQLSYRVQMCNPRPGMTSSRSISVIGNARFCTQRRGILPAFYSLLS